MGVSMKIWLILAASLLCAAPAQAQFFPNQASRLAASGSPVRLDFVYSTNPDCTAAGMPEIRIIQQPQNGRVEITKTADFPNFPASNIRSECNRRRVPGVLVRYISERGFVGADSVTIEGLFPSGANYGARRYTITVK
jgi:hypothetical protein